MKMNKSMYLKGLAVLSLIGITRCDEPQQKASQIFVDGQMPVAFERLINPRVKAGAEILDKDLSRANA